VHDERVDHVARVAPATDRPDVVLASPPDDPEPGRRADRHARPRASVPVAERRPTVGEPDVVRAAPPDRVPGEVAAGAGRRALVGPLRPRGAVPVDQEVARRPRVVRTARPDGVKIDVVDRVARAADRIAGLPALAVEVLDEAFVTD